MQQFKCPQCKRMMSASDSIIGRKIHCQDCSKEIIVLQPPPRPTSFQCPGCSRKYKIRKEMAGRRARCPECDISFIMLKQRTTDAAPQAVPSSPAPQIPAEPKETADLQLPPLIYTPAKSTGRNALIGCGTVFLILCIAFAGMFFYRYKRFVEEIDKEITEQTSDAARKKAEKKQPPKTPVRQKTQHIAKQSRQPDLAETPPNPFVKEKLRLQGDKTHITAFSLSADGKKLVTVGNRTVRLWDLIKGEEVKIVAQEDSSQMHAVSFSPDGRLLAWGVYNKIKLWDLDQGTQIRILKKHSNDVLSIDFSPDGKLIASGGMSNHIRIWDTASGRKIHALEGHSESVHSVRFSPDGKILASCSRDMSIKFWDPVSGKEIRTLQGHWRSVLCQSFSPDGKILASGSENGVIKLWNVADGSEITRLEGHSMPVKSVSFSPDGRLLATGGGYHTIKLWRLPDGGLLTTFRHPVKSWNLKAVQVAFAGNRQTLLSTGWDRTIRLWNLESEALLKQKPEAHVRKERPAASGKTVITVKNKFKGDLAPITCTSISPDSKMYACGNRAGLIEIRDLIDGKPIFSIKAHDRYVKSVSFSPDSTKLISVSRDHSVKIWNLKNGRKISELKNSPGYSCARFTPDGKGLITGDFKGQVSFHRAKNRKIIKQFKASADSIEILRFSPNGKILLTVGRDGTLKLWRASDLSAVNTVKSSRQGLESIRFSPDSRHLIYIDNDRKAVLLELADGSVIQQFQKAPQTLCFHPDGRMFASGSFDSISLWDITQPKPFLTFRGGHYNFVSGLGFTPDGLALTSIGLNNSVKIWQADQAALNELRSPVSTKTVVFSSGEYHHGNGQGITKTRHTREAFELTRKIKANSIAVLVREIDITDVSTWPRLSLRSQANPDEIIAEPLAEKITNAFAKPKFKKKYSSPDAWYWIEYVFADNPIIDRGRYFVMFELSEDSNLNTISFVKGDMSEKKGGRQKILFKMIGEEL
ncbi:hypothetical protein QUF90_02370 [Desulfococcaceae bacterium HSG9]|nr:hypothetical protein [Desulfococcaceae bacterium HSG9]